MKNSKFKMKNYDDCIVVSSLRLGIIQARLGFCSRSASSVQNSKFSFHIEDAHRCFATGDDVFLTFNILQSPILSYGLALGGVGYVGKEVYAR